MGRWFKRGLRWLLLRGALREWWIKRQSRRMESAYLRKIAVRTDAEEPQWEREKEEGYRAASEVSDGDRLRRILFIADCMWEQDQLLPGLRAICDTELLDLGPCLLETPRDGADAVCRALEERVACAGGSEPDLVFLYLRPALLSEESFHILRRRWSCPVIGMNLDDRVEFFSYRILSSGNDGYHRWAGFFDCNLTSSLAATDWYREAGAEVRYVPQGFHPDPRFLSAPSAEEIQRKFSFVGSRKPERAEIMRRLGEFGVVPDAFGSGWPAGQWIDDPSRVFRSSQINLGIGYALATGGIANAKGRDIECPAVGACYLTTYHWEISNLFEVGREILCYRNFEELVELHSFYSRRPRACLTIARAAHRRAHAEHTWEMRMRNVFHGLGFRTDR